MFVPGAVQVFRTARMYSRINQSFANEIEVWAMYLSRVMRRSKPTAYISHRGVICSNKDPPLLIEGKEKVMNIIIDQLRIIEKAL